MVCGIGVAAAVLAMTLRRLHPEQATAIALAAGTVTAAAVLTTAAPVIASMRSMLENVPVVQEYGAILFKALAIALLAQTTADICRDAGESALAGYTELAGKTLLLIMALPLFEEILRRIGEAVENAGMTV